jgi:hypothetical protein
LLVAIGAFFALFPVHSVYAVTIWKDTAFAYAFLVFAVLLVDVARSRAQVARRGWWIATFAIASFMVCATRNNGPFVVLAVAIVLVVTLRAQWRRIIPVALGPAVVALVATSGVSAALDAQQTSLAEALSIPLQQIARAAVDHGADFTDSQRAFVDHVWALSPHDLAALYTWQISDPVKAQVASDALSGDLAGFTRGWASIGASFPDSYLQQFLAGGVGYWYPGTDYWVVLTQIDAGTPGIAERNRGAPGFSATPPHSTLANALTVLAFTPRTIPVLGMGWSVGFGAWLAVLALVVMTLRRQRGTLLLSVACGVLWLTCVASPVYAEYRYLYGVVLALPVLLGLAFARMPDPDAPAQPAAQPRRGPHQR